MAIEYINRAAKKPATGEDDTRDIVSETLQEIDEGRRSKRSNTRSSWTAGKGATRL